MTRRSWGSSGSCGSRARGFGFVVAVLMARTMPALAQVSDGTVDFGGHVAVVRLSEFGVTDTGVGIDATWRATPTISLDGALTWLPGSDDSRSSRVGRQQRVLGLAGIRSGVRRGRVELFGRARGGFLRFSALEGGVCVAVTTVPLPLECQITTGYTAFATDFSGGIAIAAAPRVRWHVEAGDLMVRYGQEAHRSNGEPTNGFTSHNLQVNAGLTWRF